MSKVRAKTEKKAPLLRGYGAGDETNQSTQKTAAIPFDSNKSERLALDSFKSKTTPTSVLIRA